jgi:hypothetical protein
VLGLHSLLFSGPLMTAPQCRNMLGLYTCSCTHFTKCVGWLIHSPYAGSLFTQQSVDRRNELCVWCCVQRHKCHLWARGSPQTSASVPLRRQCLAWCCGDDDLSPCLPPDRLIAQRYRSFAESVPPRCLKTQPLPLAVKHSTGSG